MRYWKTASILSALTLSVLACRPVLTIGWAEVAIVGGLFLLLAAPFLIRVMRFIIRLQDERESGGEGGE